MKKLKVIGIYRDGGTIDYIDEKGNKYHKYQNMYESKTSNKKGNCLYLGSLRDKLDPELAKGEFKLENNRFELKNEDEFIIINQ